MSGERLDLRALARAASAPAPPAPPVARTVEAVVRYQGNATSVQISCPNGEQRMRIDRMTATLGGGLPWAQLTPLAQARFHSLAVFSVCVVAPEWVDNAVQEDDDLLFAISGAVEAHAARYFRRDLPAGEGSAGGGGVVVDFPST